MTFLLTIVKWIGSKLQNAAITPIWNAKTGNGNYAIQNQLQNAAITPIWNAKTGNGSSADQNQNIGFMDLLNVLTMMPGLDAPSAGRSTSMMTHGDLIMKDLWAAICVNPNS